jgi:hypothetical protein
MRFLVGGRRRIWEEDGSGDFGSSPRLVGGAAYIGFGVEEGEATRTRSMTCRTAIWWARTRRDPGWFGVTWAKSENHAVVLRGGGRGFRLS